MLKKRRSQFSHSEDSNSNEDASPIKRLRINDHERSTLQSLFVYVGGSVTRSFSIALDRVTDYIKNIMFKPSREPEIIDIEDDESSIEDDIAFINSSRRSHKHATNGVSKERRIYGKGTSTGSPKKHGKNVNLLPSHKSVTTMTTPILQPIASTPIHGDYKISLVNKFPSSSIFTSSSLMRKPISYDSESPDDSYEHEKPYPFITDPSYLMSDLPEPKSLIKNSDIECLSKSFENSSSFNDIPARDRIERFRLREDSKSDSEDIQDCLTFESSNSFKPKSSSKRKTFAALEMKRLEEKAVYEALIKNMTDNPSFRSSAPRNGSIAKKVVIDLTKEDDPLYSDSFITKKVHRKHLDSFLNKYYKPYKIAKPKQPAKSEIEDDDVLIIEEKKTYMKPPTSKSRIFSPEWIAELQASLTYETENRKKILAEQEKKIEYYRQRRIAKDEEEKRQLDLLCRTGATVARPKKPSDIPALTDQMRAIVEAAFMKCANMNEVLVKYDSSVLSRSDIQTLNGLNWLNDQVINHYLQMIVDRNKGNSDLPTLYNFNTFFFPRLQQSGPQSVARWTRKVDIFSFDLVFIPLHINNLHWAMCVVDNKAKEIVYYDSMEKISAPNFMNLIYNYLIFEKDNKKKSSVNPAEYSIVCAKNHPLQTNGSDCGVYTLIYADYLSRRAPLTFSQENMPYFRRRIVYECLTQKML